MAKQKTEENEKTEFTEANLYGKYGATIVPKGWLPEDNLPRLIKHSRDMDTKDQQHYRYWVKYRTDILCGIGK